MPDFIGKKIRAMFDILPVKRRVSLSLTEAEIEDIKIPNSKSQNINKSVYQNPNNQTENVVENWRFDDLVSDILDSEPREIAKLSIESVLHETEDPIIRLASLGVKIGGRMPRSELRTTQPQLDVKARQADYESNNRNNRKEIGPQSIIRNSKFDNENFYRKILDRIHEPVAPRVAITLTRSNISTQQKKREKNSSELLKIPTYKTEKREGEVASFYREGPLASPIQPAGGIISEVILAKVKSVSLPKPKLLNFHTSTKKRKIGLLIFSLLLLGAIAYGLVLKNELMQNSITAFNNLKIAGQSMMSFNFNDASRNFGKSYQDFADISQTMSMMGLGISDFLSGIPGVSKLKSAKDVTEAGKLISQSGQAMAEALKSLSQTGSILNPADRNKVKPSRIVSQIKNALILSNKNFTEAKNLIASIDETVIPEDKREKLADFKDKLPLLEEYLKSAMSYADFLQGFVGIDEPKKYLFLFQNNSELRPTGGFPGTYGVVSFSSGGLADFFVDDVYNLDGQLKRNVIPPKQLQHITPIWGMRDTGWFIDFPTSAKKAMQYFAEEAGYGVDGVIALNPDVVSEILEVVGPIKMPEYGLPAQSGITLTADNFLETIQEEVEYGENRVQPKKVVVDFAPRFLEKLYSADAEKWMKIFNVVMNGLEEKDILFYFEDKELEDFAVKEGLGGEIKIVGDDYLMINFTNVMGSKTDVVTDSLLDITTDFKEDSVVHKVGITRNHGGGDFEHGFYNRQNPAYVRILLPENAKILSVSGNDIPNYKPLLNYKNYPDFVADGDLKKFEAGFYNSEFKGVDRFTELDKQGIGFWMIVDPGATKKVEFEYSFDYKGHLCNDKDALCNGEYGFYFQKQPGLDWENFRFVFNNDRWVVDNDGLNWNIIGDKYILDEELKKDLEINLKLK